jgi:hypothetical protein
VKKISPQVQAALTRKKRALERARAAKLRSSRARYAALVRWGKVVPIDRGKKSSGKPSSGKSTKSSGKPSSGKSTKPSVRSVKPTKSVKSPVKSKKKKKPGPKKLVGIERLKRDLENEKRRRRRAEKEAKAAKAHSKARNQQVHHFIQRAETGKTRFTDLSRVPERMKGETSKQYARRLVNQIIRDGFFEGDQAYGPIASATRLPPSEVYTLFMSPEVA